MGPDPSSLVGKMVRDEWGRQIGIVVSVLMDDRGEAAWLLVKMGDGEFKRFRLSRVVADGSDVILLSSLRKSVEALYKRAVLLKRKRKILMGLKEDNLSPEMLDEMSKDVKRDLGFVEGEAKFLLRKVEQRLKRCADQMRDINHGIACLQVERDMGRISDEVFSASMKMMLSGLRNLMAERDSLLEARMKLVELLRKELPEVQEERAQEPIKTFEGPIDIEVEEGAADALQA